MTVPTLWLIDKDVALETLQDRTEDCPEVIDEGVATKEVIVGAGIAAVTVTVALAETELVLFVAVRV